MYSTIDLVRLCRGHNDKIFCLRWNPHAEDRFVTVGIKHIKFWALAGGGMTSKQGLFGKTGGKQGKQNQMCIVFGKTPDLCITGGGDGSIYIWMQTNLFKKVDDAHNGPVFAITAVQDKVLSRKNTDGSYRICKTLLLSYLGLCHRWKGWESYFMGSRV